MILYPSCEGIYSQSSSPNTHCSQYFKHYIFHKIPQIKSDDFKTVENIVNIWVYLGL